MSDGYWAKYTYIKASETCAEKFKNGGRLFEPKDEQTLNIVFKTIQKTNEEAGTDTYPADFFLGIVADTYINKIVKIGNETFGDGTLKITGRTSHDLNTYLTRIIISLGLYIFNRELMSRRFKKKLNLPNISR